MGIAPSRQTPDATLADLGGEAVATLLEHAPFAVFVVDAGLRLLAMNRRAAPIFGGLDAQPGRAFPEIAAIIWPGAYAAEVVRELRRTLETGVPFRGPRAGGAATGRMANYDWQIQRVTLPGGTACVACYAYDLTPIRETETQLRDSETRLTHALDASRQAEASMRERDARLIGADKRKDEFLATLAHELRNPLAPIRAGLELMRLSGDSGRAVERARVMMERQVGHMVRLIDDLLDISRITSGKIELQRRPTALDALVATAGDANRQAMAAAGLTLDVSLPATPIGLDVDPTRCVQVISNVLHNAVKFTDAGGRIAIGAAVDGPPETPLTITIADSGVGISAGMLPRVFDLFAQDRSAGPRAHAGLGIGLALARRLIEMHGGTIEARSDGPGTGSTFVIRLPVAATADARALSEPVRPSTGATRHRVVVIDDNLDAANAMAMLISALGGEARVAGDGASGLDQLLAWQPTLVLLDIEMPGMDGYETCRRIRRAVGWRVTVVALTGWGLEQDKRDARNAGFDGHLTKPADPAAVERLLARSTPMA